MKDTRMEAQVTVIAAIVTMLVMSLLCTSIRSAVDTAVKIKAGMAANLAVESVFANYSRPLADRFNILLLPSSELIEAAIFKKAEENCSGGGGFGKSEIQSVEIIQTTSPVDAGGAPFAESVIKYMQYGVFSEFSQMLLGHEKQLEKEQRSGELINEIAECEEEVVKTDELILELIALTDGVDNEDGFLKCSGGQPVAVENDFIKQISPDGVYAESLAVRDARVFNAMKEHYVDIKKLLDDIADDAAALEDADEKTADSEIARLRAQLSSGISYFKDLASGSLSCCERAVDVCAEYIVSKNLIREKAGKTEKNIEKSKGVIGSDIAGGLLEDVQKIKQFSSEGAICDAELMHAALKDIRPYFMSLEKYAGSLCECYDRQDYSGVRKEAGYAHDAANSIRYDSLEFDYSNVEFKNSNTNKNLLTKMKNTLSKGIMGIVVDDVSQISDKKISVNNLADTMYNDMPSRSDGIIKTLRNNILYSEYVLENFTSYTDVNGIKERTANMVDYQVEYILNGCSSDYDNLFGTVMSLSGLRECANLLYLFTDTAKKEECYALSFTLFGFTGMPALVTVGKYAIMALWAYAESLVEIRALLDNGRVELAKSTQNWNLSLENLMAMQLTKLAGDKEKDKKTDKGISYEQFLRILLFVEKGSYKYFRTMAQIELWMIQHGYADFRMKNQLFGLDAEITFKIGGYGNGKFYKNPVSYNY